MDQTPTKSVEFYTPSTDVSDLLEAAYAPNTRRAYRADIASFLEWGGSIPSTPDEIAAFISFRAINCTVATIKRQLASLSSLHTTLGHSPNPLKSRHIAATVRGLSRLHGKPQRAVEPLLIEQLRLILDSMPGSVVGKRDAALLVIGFAGGMRRSELIALDFSDIEFRSEGLVVTITSSKTDQEQSGRQIGIPYGRGPYCPVRYCRDWLTLVDRPSGPVFRSCRKGGTISAQRLSVEAVAKIVKASIGRIGANPANFSGHSLRAGFVTSAVAAGVRSDIIRKQTGHASDHTMARYIREGSLFKANAVFSLF